MASRTVKTIAYVSISVISIGVILWVFFNSAQGVKMRKYKSPTKGFIISYPTTWSYEDSNTTADVIFFSPHETDLDTFKENVNIVVQDLRATPVSLDKYSEMAIDQMKSVFGAQMTIMQTGDTKWIGEPAYEFSYTGTYGFSEPLRFYHLWMIKDDIAYQFTFASTEQNYYEYFDTVKKMYKSFKVK